jgi:hypothetical protein
MLMVVIFSCTAVENLVLIPAAPVSSILAEFS